jgi:hypothetical protein
MGSQSSTHKAGKIYHGWDVANDDKLISAVPIVAPTLPNFGLRLVNLSPKDSVSFSVKWMEDPCFLVIDGKHIL